MRAKSDSLEVVDHRLLCPVASHHCPADSPARGHHRVDQHDERGRHALGHDRCGERAHRLADQDERSRHRRLPPGTRCRRRWSDRRSHRRRANRPRRPRRPCAAKQRDDAVPVPGAAARARDQRRGGSEQSVRVAASVGRILANRSDSRRIRTISDADGLTSRRSGTPRSRRWARRCAMRTPAVPRPDRSSSSAHMARHLGALVGFQVSRGCGSAPRTAPSKRRTAVRFPALPRPGARCGRTGRV